MGKYRDRGFMGVLTKGFFVGALIWLIIVLALFGIDLAAGVFSIGELVCALFVSSCSSESFIFFFGLPLLFVCIFLGVFVINSIRYFKFRKLQKEAVSEFGGS